jgi:hypothetical protein
VWLWIIQVVPVEQAAMSTKLRLVNEIGVV